ncbi:MAG TPA: Rad52/Rad22 family DNA repair protein [Thermobifida alba]|nr:Rad52/Rad22 family DNA repair protein [Thermobifida alba]
MRGIAPDRVQVHRGNSHLEAWDVRRSLTRIFGFGGWADQTLELACIREAKERDGTTLRWTVAYRAQVRLIVRTTDGRVLTSFDDTAVGEAARQPAYGAAHDQAAKTAVSQALKRCAANLGDQLGLSLYRDGDLSPVVLWSAAHPPPGSEEEPDTDQVGPGATDPDAALTEALLGRVANASTTDQLNRLWARVADEEAEGLPAGKADQVREALHARFSEISAETPEKAAAAQDADAETPDTR